MRPFCYVLVNRVKLAVKIYEKQREIFEFEFSEERLPVLIPATQTTETRN